MAGGWAWAVLLLPAAAAGAAGESALDRCWQGAESRIQLGECLRRERAREDARLVQAYADARVAQRQLDRVVGLRRASRNLDRAQQAFVLYRDLECHQRELQAGSGTGSGDFFLACWVDQTRARIVALEGLMPRGDTEAVAPADLEGSGWRVEDIEARGVVDFVQSTLVFEGGGRVHGNAGCNRYQGSVQAGGDGLRFGPLASTRRMCPEAVMDQERRVLDALERTRRMERRADLLFLYGEGPDPLLRLARLDEVEADSEPR